MAEYAYFDTFTKSEIERFNIDLNLAKKIMWHSLASQAMRDERWQGSPLVFTMTEFLTSVEFGVKFDYEEADIKAVK